ncbi:MAG: hypothetical protein WBC05_24420 [Sedimentisphaerales bacterium]
MLCKSDFCGYLTATLLLLSLFSCTTWADIEEFAFQNLEIQVLREDDTPVENADLRIYSQDWPVAYPANASAFTDVNGICRLHIPRGKWKIVVGKGSDPGLFLINEVIVESATFVQIKPDHALTLEFIDCFGAPSRLDALYAAPSEMVPNCKMPVIARPSSLQCEIKTNASELLALFLVQNPKTTSEGYYLFVDEIDPNTNLTVRSDEMSLNSIDFEGYLPPGVTDGSVVWRLCFPYQDIERHWVFVRFVLTGLGRAWVNVDYADYMAELILRSSELDDDIYYRFQYQPIDFSSLSSVTLRAGGEIHRQFRYAPIPFSKNLSQFLLGPTLDDYGNELRWYAPGDPDVDRFGPLIKIWESSRGKLVYDGSFPITSTQLGFLVLQGFPDSSVFRLEWDMPGYGGFDIIEGWLSEPQYRFDHHTITTEHFIIHVPTWYEEKGRLLAPHWEEAYTAMVNLIGRAPPVTSEANFYIHPVGTWAHLQGQELFYHGFTWWHPRNPIKWERYCFHEIGHRLVSELYRQGPVQYPIQGELNEYLAEMISHYTIAQTHGEEFCRYIWDSHSHHFFGYMEDPENSPNGPWYNGFFLLEVYLTKTHGWEIHKQFFRRWLDACQILDPLGYEPKEIFAALYSSLANENLLWMFNLCNFDLDDLRMAEAIEELSAFTDGLPISNGTISISNH